MVLEPSWRWTRSFAEKGIFRRWTLKFSLILLVFLALALGLLFAWTRYQAAAIEERYPPVGTIIAPQGKRLHFVDLPAHGADDAPIVLFVHGASGNLNDPRLPLAPALLGRARLIFVDRPGHGYSERGEAETPSQQAERYRVLLDSLAVEKVVVVGHSLGAASAAAFSVLYPERTQGLVFVAPATHPWPTGVAWYYKLASLPVVGYLFSETIALPVGNLLLGSAIDSTFAPQEVPSNYIDKAAIPLVFRPRAFRANARDVAGLSQFVQDFSMRYREIKVPTIIITGDRDGVVSPAIHSLSLEREIEGSQLVILPGIGHKPEYSATKQVADAILSVAR